MKMSALKVPATNVALPQLQMSMLFYNTAIDLFADQNMSLPLINNLPATFITWPVLVNQPIVTQRQKKGFYGAGYMLVRAYFKLHQPAAAGLEQAISLINVSYLTKRYHSSWFQSGQSISGFLDVGIKPAVGLWNVANIVSSGVAYTYSNPRQAVANTGNALYHTPAAAVNALRNLPATTRAIIVETATTAYYEPANTLGYLAGTALVAAVLQTGTSGTPTPAAGNLVAKSTQDVLTLNIRFNPKFFRPKMPAVNISGDGFFRTARTAAAMAANLNPAEDEPDTISLKDVQQTFLDCSLEPDEQIIQIKLASIGIEINLPINLVALEQRLKDYLNDIENVYNEQLTSVNGLG